MKSITGIVVSDKMNKTVSVSIDRIKVHPLYKKRSIIKKKFHAHNDLGAKIGDKVKIVSVRPISKTVKFKVLEIIK